MALMWLFKSIAVIKKTTFLIFYHVQQHENLNSDNPGENKRNQPH